VEIWCGQSQGAMAIFSLTDSVVTSQDIVHHTLGKQARPFLPSFPSIIYQILTGAKIFYIKI
jgi:hypothetical protein